MTRAGELVDLTATEYRLLRYLMLNPRRVLTRAQLLEHVWDYDFGGDARVLETYVSYLRKKLDLHGPPLIHTVRGVGYALRAPAGVMASLRARLRRGAARARGRSACCCSAAITYAEQRSFLYDRVDQQVARRRSRPSSASSTTATARLRPRPARRPGAAAAPGAGGLPPGTYGERRDADRQGARRRRSSSATTRRTARPTCPASIPIGRD